MTDPAPSPTLRQGDVIEVDGQKVVVVSRTCDLQPGRSGIAHVANLEQTGDRRAIKGWNPRLVRVPALEVGNVADMLTARPIPLDRLAGLAVVRGCDSVGAERQFRREAGRYLSMVSMTDDVNATVKPMWRHLSEKRDDEFYKPLIDAISHVRARFIPNDPAPDQAFTLHLTFVIDGTKIPELPAEVKEELDDLQQVRDAWASAETLDERGKVAVQYCRVLAGKTKPEGLVKAVATDVVTDLELTAAQYLASDPIEIDYLSLDEDVEERE